MIKYRIVQDKENIYRIKFQILEQTFRTGRLYLKENGRYSSHFIASNGFEIRSNMCPEIQSSCLYVRGDSVSKDFDWLNIPIEMINRVITAIDEYNEITVDRINV